MKSCGSGYVDSQKGIFMDTCTLQYGISRKLLAGATDAVLVKAAKSGDHTAFAQLWERHSNKVFLTVCRITGNRDDAEDVLQEAWMKVYTHLKTFVGRASFSTWVTRIAINSALMALRRKRAHPETSMEVYVGDAWHFLEVADQTKDVEELFTRQESAQRLKQAIRRLRPRLRKVVEIQQLNDRSLKETADLAGITVGATKSRLFHARISLRKALQRESNAAPQRASPSLSITRARKVV
ncbi:RNA polymerase sigma factor [Acidicapsa acidisoli]|uniref:RNA polymerase sigma factor n=1 Tax=Acidicapsa acidisoli TaxID=1615681 RepID=UPI0021E0444E|nr:RNA polymerase sigma factor [Acidicapsa acidisoli]